MKEIILSQGKVALVDDEDYLFLNQYKWAAGKQNNSWYALRTAIVRGKRIGLKMHRIILNTPDY